MSLYFCPLYSGSSGNVLFVQYGHTRLLVDAGRTGTEIEEALEKIGASADTISGILITHEHSDHIKAAGILARKYAIPVYATEQTWSAMLPKVGKVSQDLQRVIDPDHEFYLGDVGVAPFRIPHDAADPVGYRLYGGKYSVSTATDLGVFGEDVYRRIAGSSLILLESNHDPEMLRANPHYTSWLKRRILGDRGHLSNEACARALVKLARAGTGHVILGHLSGENNTPELALKVNRSAAEREGIPLRIDVAQRDRAGSLYLIGDAT